MYRLGMGTESTFPRRFLGIPTDYAKWARIAEHIIMHYNEGWANGFRYNIKYWEIWNEADIFEYWPGSRKEYISFYSQVSNYLKKRFPNILIGPSGWANMFDPAHEEMAQNPEKAVASRRSFFNSICKGAADGDYPMDFFPWHIYGKTSAKTELYCSQIDELFDKYGLHGKVENINTEWNNVSLKRYEGKPGAWDFSQMVLMKSAICLINSMIVMQKHNCTKAAYYDPDERTFFCGTYYFGGEIRNHYYSMKAFEHLKQGGTEVETSGDTETVRMCASANEKRAVVLIGNESKETENVTLSFKNIGQHPYTIYLFDEKTKLEPGRRGKLGNRAMSLRLAGESAVVIVIDKEGK